MTKSEQSPHEKLISFLAVVAAGGGGGGRGGHGGGGGGSSDGGGGGGGGSGGWWSCKSGLHSSYGNYQSVIMLSTM